MWTVEENTVKTRSFNIEISSMHTDFMALSCVVWTLFIYEGF